VIFGSGTGAGCIGLELALREGASIINVILDVIEPSLYMHQAADYFLEEFSKDFDLLRIESVRKVDIDDSDFPQNRHPTRTIKILSAFHLALPYQQASTKSEASLTLSNALRQFNADICMFSVNHNKIQFLKDNVREYVCLPNFKTGHCGIPQISDGDFKTPTGSEFLWAISEDCL